MCIEDSYTLRTEMNEFKKFAVGHLGMNSLALDNYMQVQSSYISPTIIEERPMNVAQMDVFSRLMMDRIIFLGTQINDYTANVIQAQLLFLDSSLDLYQLSGWLGLCGLRDLRHDAVHRERCIYYMYGDGSIHGFRPPRRRDRG